MRKYFFIVVFLLVPVFTVKAWFFTYPSSCEDHGVVMEDGKLCMEFINSGSFGLNRIGWFGFATSSEVFGDSATSTLLGHQVIAFVTAYPNLISLSGYAGCGGISNSCDDPLNYREISPFRLYDQGVRQITFLADKTGECWEHKGFWDINDCLATGAILVGEFELTRGQLLERASLFDSSKYYYLDLVSVNSDDFNFNFSGLSQGQFVLFFASVVFGLIVFILIYVHKKRIV